MRDSAVVLKVESQLAWVRVNPLAACGQCSARPLCVGHQNSTGRIAVYNPLQARPGDEVEIEVPEANYEKQMMGIFGLLLGASLVGLGLGYLIRPLSLLGPNGNALAGLLVGLLFAGAALLRHSRKQKKKAGFPVIVEILNRGGSHGKA